MFGVRPSVPFLLVALCSICLGVEPGINFDPPDYVEQMPSKEFIPEISKPGSLFGQGERPLFADRRAMKPNDLITVVISENASANYSTSKDYTSTSNGTSNAPRLTYNGTDPNKREQAQFLDNRNNYSLTQPATNNTFKGGGAQKKSENLKLTITARIVKVLENGNYFIYGSREILVDGEKQVIKISGVVRPFDINRDNSVQSKYIADAKIAYTNIGPLSASNKKKMASDVLQSQFPY
ncbi:flagellar basal body L-ring protein FlgH [Helicobacter bizzozeronii]|uniref:Flagellar L-ring protein n=1 Tax=Helicobacter bizzozeronii (strain CIII-1) TaxID=1002804 RepID=F8KTC7_HELBC|nr:flagellar basal body L-ring protein FlgH [Helicobacter bizzozeronii]GMB92676.1 Flagellar basal body L-ring protein FlgH [Helicobacter bizzozeronii]CCB80078.1 flagellar L-ring protein FlgH [Helicobacter bizzozeronii CIII-1]